MNDSLFNINIKVMGIGGGGINALDDITASYNRDVNFFALNSDLQDLNNCSIKHKVQLGASTTKEIERAPV